MPKLMLKRFILSGAIFILCLVIIYACAYIYNYIPNLRPIMKALTYVLCAIGSLVFVFILKMRNFSVQNRYFEYMDSKQKSFKNNCLFVLKSKEHLASLLVVNCIFIPTEISIALKANWSVPVAIFYTLLMILAQNIVFIAADCLLWVLTFALKGKKRSTPQ